jgi:hypothetical protein
VGAATAVLSVLIVTALAQRYPRLPALGASDDVAAWRAVAVGSWVVAAGNGRDAYARVRVGSRRA